MSELLLMDRFDGEVRDKEGRAIHRTLMWEHDEENYDIIIERVGPAGIGSERIPLIGKNEVQACKTYDEVLKEFK